MSGCRHNTQEERREPTMRIKALASCAKDDGNLTLLDDITTEGMIARQYVMLPNRAIYPLDGMPLLNEETLLAVMDVPKEKRDAYQVVRAQITERLRLMMEDARNTDCDARRGIWGLAMNGMTLTPVFRWGSNDSVYFVETDLVKVLADYRGLEMAVRVVDGSPVIVVMNGLMTVACLMPTLRHWTKEEARQMHIAGMEAGRMYDRLAMAEANEHAQR